MSEPLLELHDSEISAAELEAWARANLAQRNAQLGEVSVAFPSYGSAAVPPDAPHDLPQLMNLHHHLSEVNKLYNQFSTDSVLAESPAAQAPLLGSLWRRVREQAHQLVLFYVNRTVGEQTAVNAHAAHALNELTRLVQEQQRTIEQLRAEIKQLQKNGDEA